MAEVATEHAPSSGLAGSVPRRQTLAEWLTFPSLAIVKRETIAYMRQRRTAFWLLLLVAAGIFWVLKLWPERGLIVSQLAGAPQTSSESRRVFFGTGQVFLLGCMVLLPPVAASAIASERQKDTLAQLSVTLIRPGSLLLAKVANTLGFFAMLVLAYTPIFGTLFFLPGVDATEFACLVITIVATAFGCAGLGLLASSMVSNTTAATVLAYIAIVVFQTSPFGVISGLHRAGAGEMIPAIAVLAVYEGFLFTVSLLVARALLRFHVHKPPQERKERVIDDVALLRMRRSTYPFYLVDPLRRKKPIGDRVNPIFVREIFWGLTRNLTNLIRITYVALCVFVLGAATAATFRGWYWDVRQWMTFEIGAIVVLIPPFVAGAFAREQEVGNLDMLRMTLIRPWKIISGKTLGTASSILCVCSAAMVSCLMLLWLDAESWRVTLQGFVSLLVSAFYALSLTMLVSVLCRKTVSAILVAYGVLAAAFVAIPLAMAEAFPWDYIERYAGLRFGSPEWQSGFAVFLSPWTAYAVEGPHAVGAWYWALNCAVFTGVSALLLLLASRFFRKFRLQDI